MIFDTHAHYDAQQFDQDRDTILSSMNEQGVGLIVNASSDWDSLTKVINLTQQFPFVYGAIGIHPDSIGGLTQAHFTDLKTLARLEKIVAIGEIGLDYYWDAVPRQQQKDWFIAQLELARELALPVIVHSRDAAHDTLEIMQKHGQGLNAVIHCFSYGVEMAREFVKLGNYIGIGGVLTFKNAKKIKEVVADIPLDNLLLETDCPYLAPDRFRGKRNNSSYLSYVASAMADLKGVSTQEVEEITMKNGCELFNIKEVN